MIQLSKKVVTGLERVECSFAVFRDKNDELHCAIGCGCCGFSMAIIRFSDGKIVKTIEMKSVGEDDDWFVCVCINMNESRCILSENYSCPLLVHYDDDYRVEKRILGSMKCGEKNELICVIKDPVVVCVNSSNIQLVQNELIIFDIQKKKVTKKVNVEFVEYANITITSIICNGEFLIAVFEDSKSLEYGIAILETENFNIISKLLDKNVGRILSVDFDFSGKNIFTTFLRLEKGIFKNKINYYKIGNLDCTLLKTKEMVRRRRITEVSRFESLFYVFDNSMLISIYPFEKSNENQSMNELHQYNLDERLFLPFDSRLVGFDYIPSCVLNGGRNIFFIGGKGRYTEIICLENYMAGRDKKMAVLDREERILFLRDFSKYDQKLVQFCEISVLGSFGDNVKIQKTFLY